jgi:hypothetical protein
MPTEKAMPTQRDAQQEPQIFAAASRGLKIGEPVKLQ